MATSRFYQTTSQNHQPEKEHEGNSFTVGQLTFRALNTPGHSPDSLSIVLSREGRDVAVFTGNTLFVGDVGRPDLRETAGNLTAKLMPLAAHVLVYPAYGAGSLCGKALSDANSSTIGAEKASNPMLRPLSEADFGQELLADQPFLPQYFGYDVALNKAGAPTYAPSVQQVPRLAPGTALATGALVVDARPEAAFKKGHVAGAINMQQGGKFETWLGAIVGRRSRFAC